MAAPEPNGHIGGELSRASTGLVINNDERVRQVHDRGEAQFRIDNKKGRMYRRKITWPEKIDSDFLAKTKSNLWHAREMQKNQKFIKNLQYVDNTRFIPRARFYKIITPEAVLHIVNLLECYKGKSPNDKMRVAQDIFFGNPKRGQPPCHRLLAALILMESERMAHRLASFIEEGMSDDCLPLKSDPDHLEECKLVCRHKEHSHQLINNNNVLGSTRENFQRSCELIMVPYLIWGGDALHCHYVLEAKGPLPFVYEKSATVGGFGEVYCVRIDDEDRSPSFRVRDDNRLFALKRLIPEPPLIEETATQRSERELQVRTLFDLELSSLIFAETRASEANEDPSTKKRVIEVFATIEIHDLAMNSITYCLLFPWADGNLKEFWAKEERLATREEDLGWMIQQLYWLTKALRAVHNDQEQTRNSRGLPSNRLYGRHGDVKPANILYFRDRGGERMLVWGDFGLGRINSRLSRSRKQAAPLRGTTTYEAPEFDEKGDHISRKTDIFSLGCVFLEFITWFLRDDAAVDEFSLKRLEPDPDDPNLQMDTFYEPTSPRNLKKGVTQWIEDLGNDDGCVEAVDAIRLLIRDKMLQIDPKERISSESLERELNEILRKWTVDEGAFRTRHHRKADLDAVEKPIPVSVVSKFATNVPRGWRRPFLDRAKPLARFRSDPKSNRVNPPVIWSRILDRAKPLARFRSDPKSNRVDPPVIWSSILSIIPRGNSTNRR